MAKHPEGRPQNQPSHKRKTRPIRNIPETDQSLWAEVIRRDRMQRRSLLKRILKGLRRL